MRISFDEEETTMTTDKTTLVIRAQLGARFQERRAVTRREKKLFRLFPKELMDKEK